MKSPAVSIQSASDYIIMKKGLRRVKYGLDSKRLRIKTSPCHKNQSKRVDLNVKLNAAIVLDRKNYLTSKRNRSIESPCAPCTDLSKPFCFENDV